MIIFLLLALIALIHGSLITTPVLSPQEIVQKLSVDEKIGQLFMAAVVADPEANAPFMETQPYKMEPDYVHSLIEQYHVGNIIFLGKSSKDAQKKVTKQLQQKSKIPLLIGQDFEPGLVATRLSDGMSFPHAMVLGALDATHNHLIQELGQLIGLQAQLLGVHINFAPVADLNNNPDNPVINDRSFGHDRERVAQKAQLFAQGLMDAGIISDAKHVPGHGDTTVDSHDELPTIKHSYEKIMNDLFPFKHLIDSNIPTLMLGHLSVPALDQSGTPASCSKTIINFIRNTLKFKGAIFTDGLGMGALTKLYQQPGQVEKEALLAGNDCLLCPVDVPAAIKQIKQAIEDGQLTLQELDKHVLAMLRLKSWAHAHKKSPVNEEYLYQKMQELKQAIYNNAITLIKNDQKVLPISATKKVLVVSIDHTKAKSNFFKFTNHFFIGNDKEFNKAVIDSIKDSRDADTVLVIALESMERSCKTNYGITATMQEALTDLSTLKNDKILVVFGNPYVLRTLSTDNYNGIVVAYDHSSEAQEAATHLLHGTITARGILPVTLG